jgi:hypothetical protein
MHYFRQNIFGTKGTSLKKYCNFTKNPYGLLFLTSVYSGKKNTISNIIFLLNT